MLDPARADHHTGAALPLVLDIDGTLIHGDLLHETIRTCLRTRPLVTLLAAPVALLSGRASLKRRLAAIASPDVDSMPFRREVIALANAAVAAGRPVWIASAAELALAIRLTNRLPFRIEGVLASDGAINLKGRSKADVLARRFPRGFDYVGDSHADLAVWRRAAHGYVVNPSPRLARMVRALGVPVEVIVSTLTHEGPMP